MTNAFKIFFTLLVSLISSYSFGECMDSSIYYLTNRGLIKHTQSNINIEVAKLDDSRIFSVYANSLSVVDSCHILMSIGEYREGKLSENIYLVDIKSGKMSFIGNGFHPVYIGNSGIMFYLDKMIGTNSSQIFFRNIRDVQGGAYQVTNENGGILPTDAIIPISTSEVIIQHGYEKNKAIIYNYVNRSSRNIYFPRSCSIMYWQSGNNRLICYNTEKRYIYSSDLNFKDIYRININLKLYDVVGYSDANDELYLNRPYGLFYGDKFEFLGYKLRSGEFVLYDRNLQLWDGGVVGF